MGNTQQRLYILGFTCAMKQWRNCKKDEEDEDEEDEEDEDDEKIRKIKKMKKRRIWKSDKTLSTNKTYMVIKTCYW